MNNDVNGQQNMFEWGYNEWEKTDDGYKVRSPIEHWKKLGKALLVRSTRLDELRVERKMLEQKIAIMSYVKGLEYLSDEQRRLASLTYWRMPISFVSTPFYTRAFEILAENPAQVCMMPEVLKELKAGERYEMTVFVKSADEHTAEIIEPYFTGTVESAVDMSSLKNGLARVGFTYTDGKIRIVDSVKSGVPFEVGEETISFVREPYLPYINEKASVGSVLNVPNQFGDLCFQIYLTERYSSIDKNKLDREADKDIASPAVYEMLIDIIKNSIADKEGARKHELNMNFLNRDFVEAHKDEHLNKLTFSYPADKLPPYTEIRAYEEFSDEIALVHGCHITDDNKIFITRELRVGHDETKSTVYRAPIKFSMELSHEPFMR